ncbi:MAG: UDP-N-acetylglucosamine 2-epimerase (hydrolyzing), partial [Muribaculaceae bacterium]|nr:UDP-N-acetylglucosamine 2-epimerase (hydrolyzing) [Muribaculaceae bacterium]
GVPIIHIAGGTISEGAFDDSVRHAISKMATLHFPETEKSADRLIQMGENPDSVVVAGAIGVQNSLNLPKWSRQQLSESLGWDPGSDFLVVTLHAATLESFSPLEVQQNMLQALGKLPPHIRLLITYPNSDVDPAPLIADLQKFAEAQGDRVKLIPSLGRIRYLSAVALSRGVVGNSSSGLVEVPSLGVPTLDIGIRQQGRECGSTVVHCGTSVSDIAAGLDRILSDEMRKSAKQAENPYYQPDTVKIITDRILSTDFHPYPIKKFHSS